MKRPDERPSMVRDWLFVSAVTIGGYVLGLLSPKTFFARDEQSGPALYWLMMPILRSSIR